MKGTHEKHHVIPTSLGGSNDTLNIVNLTYKEHFLIHWLLTKFTNGRDKIKMLHALYKMSHISQDHEKRVCVGWRFELSRKSQQEAMIGNNLAKGYKHDPETINQIKNTNRNNPVFFEIGKKVYSEKTDAERKKWHSSGAKKSNVTRPLETKIRAAKIASDAAKLVVTPEELRIRGKMGAQKANSVSPEERSERQRKGWATRRDNMKKLVEMEKE